MGVLVPRLHPEVLRYPSPECPKCRSPLSCSPGRHSSPWHSWGRPSPQGAPWGAAASMGTSSPLQVVNPRKKMKKKKYLNSGTVRTGDTGRGHGGRSHCPPLSPLSLAGDAVVLRRGVRPHLLGLHQGRVSPVGRDTSLSFPIAGLGLGWSWWAPGLGGPSTPRCSVGWVTPRRGEGDTVVWGDTPARGDWRVLPTGEGCGCTPSLVLAVGPGPKGWHREGAAPRPHPMGHTLCHPCHPQPLKAVFTPFQHPDQLHSGHRLHGIQR